MHSIGVQSIAALLLKGYDYVLLYLGLVWLGLLTLGWTLLAAPLYLLLPARYAMGLGRYSAMLLFRSYLASLSISRRCRFDLGELDTLRGAAPLIIAPNHPCLLDAIMIISRLPNVACVMKSELMRNVFLSAGARLAHYIRSEPIRPMIIAASDDLNNGSHLLLFAEGTRTTSPPINALKGSIALIAMRAQVPVQTVLIETNSPFLSKGWSLFKMPSMPISYKIRLGKRFDPPQNAHHFMAELDAYFHSALVPVAPGSTATDAPDAALIAVTAPVLPTRPAQAELFPMRVETKPVPSLHSDGTPS